MTKRKADGTKPPSHGGEDAKAKAMKLLADGYTVTAAGELAGVDRKTVRRWRDSVEGMRLLDEARKARDAELATSAEAARRTLREAAPLAAQRLRDRLSSSTPFEAINAAEAILSRVGVPRATKVEGMGGSTLDLSRLSQEELDQLEALHEKASTSGGTAP